MLIVKKPSENDILKALKILEQSQYDVSCVYCGDKMTEWDHLYPLVKGKYPTGYIIEISNLVPACGKCNQSKGNSDWKEWILSNATLSPNSKRTKNLHKRIRLIEKYEIEFKKTKLNLEEYAGSDLWQEYWMQYEKVIYEMRKAQTIMDQIKQKNPN